MSDHEKKVVVPEGPSRRSFLGVGSAAIAAAAFVGLTADGQNKAST
jgi:hypothetical protein